MTNQEALQVVSVASQEYKGTRAQHETIAQALDVINKLVNPPQATQTPALPDNVVPINS